jgi:hypothetical protein
MTFANDGYQVLPNFLETIGIDVNDVEKYLHYRFNFSKEKIITINPSIKGTREFAFYADPFMEVILEKCVAPFSDIVGCNLYPSYSYTRKYSQGNELLIHRDRKSCQISATLSIAFEGTEINPICFSESPNKENAVALYLKPGDLCLYRGCDLWHWRPPINNDWYLQSFLHFVDADGPYKQFKYDRRNSLGEPEPRISVKLDTNNQS